MKIIEGIEQLDHPIKNTVVTIGNFDGVHLGHQTLFRMVIEKARALNGTAVALTFNPHPMQVLKKGRLLPLLTLHEQKMELIAAAGMDMLVSLAFTPAFADLSAEAFVRDILVDKIGANVIVVGADYSFGRGRSGDLALLEELGQKWGFSVTVPDWVTPDNIDTERISSTRIRQLIKEGRIAQASRMLGRFYQLRGSVTKGRERGGRLLGFPTANIEREARFCPRRGVYAVSVKWQETCWPGVANIGYSPTFDDHIFTIEVHLIDFDQDLYGQTVRVDFVERLRDEMKFDGLDALTRQIEADIARARRLLRQADGRLSAV